MSNFEIINQEDFSSVIPIYLRFFIHSWQRAAKPGQFVIVMLKRTQRKIPLTIADFVGQKQLL